jgi:hypothetical protein
MRLMYSGAAILLLIMYGVISISFTPLVTTVKLVTMPTQESQSATTSPQVETEFIFMNCWISTLIIGWSLLILYSHSQQPPQLSAPICQFWVFSVSGVYQVLQARRVAHPVPLSGVCRNIRLVGSFHYRQ